MIWIVLFFIIILVSAVLAFRSMRDYEEFPDSVSSNALFFIANPQQFSESSLKKLHSRFSSEKQIFSLERLNKGKERALAVFGPRELVEILPQLNLVEIEDYIADDQMQVGGDGKKVSVDHSLTWLIEPKSVSKKQLHIGAEIKDLNLSESQKFFMQIVSLSENKNSENFQVSLRAMVVDPDPIGRVMLAKKINQILEVATGLKKHEDNFPEQKKFESFKQRSLIPKEVSEFLLSAEELFALIS